MKFKCFLKEERKNLGLTQIEVAEFTGISLVSQSSYETGKRFPDTRYLAKLSELGFDLNYIVTGQRIENHLNHEEALLLKEYREADRTLQQAVLVLLVRFGETIETIKSHLETSIDEKQSSTKNQNIFHGDVQNVIEGDVKVKNQRMK